MNKAELIETVLKNLGENFTKKQAEAALNSVLDGIQAGLRMDAKVQLLGFGTFSVKDRAAREGRNPKTGEKMTIQASRTVAFKPASAVKESC